MKPVLARVALTLALLLAFAGCAAAIPPSYHAAAGDLVFQSLPHGDLVDAIEGMTASPYSHCGLVERKDDHWFVIEAIGPVRETPLEAWIGQGRGHRFAACRLSAALQPKVPAILAAARTYLGRPYDIHYQFDDERIYCSELIYKAVFRATAVHLGTVQTLGELHWQPYAAFIRSIKTTIPYDRPMITPRALSEAPEVTRVYNDLP